MNFFPYLKITPKGTHFSRKTPCFISKAGANIERFIQPNKIVAKNFKLFYNLSSNHLKINRNPRKTNKILRKEVPN
jgi:hypothetical protein